MRKSRVLREIEAGQLAACMKLNLCDPRVVEIAGLAGSHALWMCNEHVPNDWLNLENCIRAAKLHDVDAIVRVSKGSYSDYLKPFEADASGIMVPHVTTAEEAEAIVDMCRFMPVGRRAMDGGNIDGQFCAMPIPDYIRYCNEERYIIIQIESPEAVENIDAIAAVPGYDFLLFGPGDYAHRIGHPGNILHPQLLEARAKVEAAARKHGKMLFAVGAPGNPAELWQRGYRVRNLGSDVTTLLAGLRKAVDGFFEECKQSANPPVKDSGSKLYG